MVNLFEKMDCFDDQYPDLESYYYERLKLISQDLRGNDVMIVGDDVIRGLAKAALTTADAGAVNEIYSLDVFLQYSTQPTGYGILPKSPWAVQGYRAVSVASKTSGLGIAEGAALGTAVEPTYVEVPPSPKEIELVSDYSQRLAVLSQIADAVSPDQNRVVVEKDFYKSLEADLLDDVTTLPVADFESLDRVTSSYSEVTAGLCDAGDSDIYGIDRDAAASWIDGNCDHASGTDRDLTIALIEALRTDQEPYWDTFPNGKVYLTGFDSWSRWSQLEGTKQRLGSETFTVSVGDGITSPGAKAGFKIATWDGIPIIRSDGVAKDTISRIYLFDLDYLGIAFGKPIQYIESDDPFAVGHLIKGAHYGIGELYCTMFKGQGKLRDLK